MRSSIDTRGLLFMRQKQKERARGIRSRLFLVFATVAQGEALEDSQATATTVVNGDVLYWEGEELVVKEMPGRETRLRVTADTKVEGVASRLKNRRQKHRAGLSRGTCSLRYVEMS